MNLKIDTFIYIRNTHAWFTWCIKSFWWNGKIAWFSYVADVVFPENILMVELRDTLTMEEKVLQYKQRQLIYCSISIFQVEG